MELYEGTQVTVVGPAAEGSTFATSKETTVARRIVNEDGKTVYLCAIPGWGYVPFPGESLEVRDAG